MPQLTDYYDYREYLKDLYAERKSAQAFFSYRYFGMRIGVDAGNLVKIINKQRHLAGKSVDRVAEFCRFNSRERKYFKALVGFCKAKSQDRIQHYFEQLAEMRGESMHELASSHYEFYRKWYHTAIVGLLHLAPFKGTNAQLADMLIPRISAEEVKESLALLLRLGLIHKKADGTLVPVDKALTTGEKWHNAAVAQFQSETIDLAKRALDTMAKSQRDISTVSITVNDEDLEEIREVTREYRKAVLGIAKGSQRPDRVCQLNIQLFPLAKSTEAVGRKRES